MGLVLGCTAARARRNQPGLLLLAGVQSARNRDPFRFGSVGVGPLAGCILLFCTDIRREGSFVIEVDLV